MDTLRSIATLGAGICIIYLGYLIGVKKMLTLLIGYSDKHFYGDKNKYTTRTGLTVIILGIIVISIPLSLLIFGGAALQFYKYIIGIYIIMMIVISNYWRFRF
ncbi:DUF3784 domain-containing protein [Bacillus sp. 1P06AnD]|uniref:DUF3784 domain-containing protein n=1 Tax=Bacillus sp. 1P06AnD TaxID=3132208 RepID=UPI0039A29854